MIEPQDLSGPGQHVMDGIDQCTRDTDSRRFTKRERRRRRRRSGRAANVRTKLICNELDISAESKEKRHLDVLEKDQTAVDQWQLAVSFGGVGDELDDVSRAREWETAGRVRERAPGVGRVEGALVESAGLGILDVEPGLEVGRVEGEGGHDDRVGEGGTVAERAREGGGGVAMVEQKVAVEGVGLVDP